MTKYLETKKNSIEEAIKSVVEKKLDPVNKVAVKKKFDNRKDKDIDNDGDVDSTDKYLHKRRKAISKAISKEETELDETVLDTVRSISKGGSRYRDQGKDKDGKFIVKDRLGKVITSLSPDGAKKFLDSLKDPVSGKSSIDTLKKDRERRASGDSGGMGVRTRGTPEKNVVNLLRKFKEETELDEGYESEVMKVLNKADIDGYFKMGKLYVNKRDGKDAKKALEDSDDITKLPKMVMEDDKMMKLTKRQRQALSSPAAKGKGKGGITLPGADFLSKKKQPMKVGRQSQVVKYEAYDIGNDYAKHTLRVTPGQTNDDVDELLGVIEKKKTSMRETLAKMWGMSEGKNPFEKKDLTKETKDGKTMTGQKPTTVKVNPKIEDK